MTAVPVSTPVEEFPRPAAARRSVVLLGGQDVRAFEAVRNLGCRVVYVDESISWDLLPLVDVPLEASLDNWEQVATGLEALARRDRVDAVVTHSESSVPLMAYLNRRLKLPVSSLSLAAAWNCRDKLRTRQGLQKAGLPTVRFQLVNDRTEAVAAARAIGYPVVVKPRDGTGGFGVRLCFRDAEVADAVEVVIQRSADSNHYLPGALVEEYLEGRELAVQTLTWAGKTELVSVLETQVSAGPVFVELGYDFPTRLPCGRIAELSQVVTATIQALGVDNWLTHTQIRLTRDGFKVIEVNARRPGGRLVAMTEAVAGVDLLSAAVMMALGEPPPRPRLRAAHSLYRSIVFEQGGHVDYDPDPSWQGLESDIAPIVEMDVQPGDPVLPYDRPEGGVYGRILLCGSSREALERDYDRIRAQLGLRLLPSLVAAPSGVDARQGWAVT